MAWVILRTRTTTNFSTVLQPSVHWISFIVASRVGRMSLGTLYNHPHLLFWQRKCQLLMFNNTAFIQYKTSQFPVSCYFQHKFHDIGFQHWNFCTVITYINHTMRKYIVTDEWHIQNKITWHLNEHPVDAGNDFSSFFFFFE